VQLFTVTVLVILLVHSGKMGEIKKLGLTVVKVILASIPLIITGYFFARMPDFAEGMSLVSKMRVIPAGLISMTGFVIIGYLIGIDIIREMIDSYHWVPDWNRHYQRNDRQNI